MMCYSDRQLMVIGVVASVFAAAAVAPLMLRNSKKGPVFHSRPEFVYELRGDVPGGGFYFFSRKQTLGELLQACGGSTPEGRYGAVAAVPVKNGNRVIFSREVRFGEMDARARLNFFLPIKVNSATAEDLMCIPGIGKKTARKIIHYRQQRGSIASLNDLTAVNGIGKKRLASLRPYLTVGESK